MAELTDPGTELSELIVWMRALPDGKQPTIAVVAKALDVDSNSAELIEGLGGVMARLTDAEQLAEFLRKSGQIHQSHVDDIRAKVKQTAKVFHPIGLAGPWSQTRQILTADLSTSFLWIGPFLQARRRLYRLTDKEREQAIAGIDETLAELEKSIQLGFDREVLRAGLTRARSMLKLFAFFGHEKTSAQLAYVKEQIEVSIQATSPSDILGGLQVLKAAKNRVGLILAVMGALSGPDAAATAVSHYAGLLRGENVYDFKFGINSDLKDPPTLPSSSTLALPKPV